MKESADKKEEEFYRVRFPKLIKIIELSAIQFKVRGVSNVFLSNLLMALKKSGEFSLDGEEELGSLLVFVSELPANIVKLVANPTGTIVRWNTDAKVEDAISQVKDRLFGGQATQDSIGSDTDGKERGEKSMEVECEGAVLLESTGVRNESTRMEIEMS